MKSIAQEFYDHLRSLAEQGKPFEFEVLETGEQMAVYLPPEGNKLN